MSEVAHSHRSEAAYHRPSVELHESEGPGEVNAGASLQGSGLQHSVDAALVEALLQMLVGLAQNQGLPKYKLNEIIDFLKDFLTQGGSVAAGQGSDAVEGTSPQSGGVHLTAGDQIEVGGKTVIAAMPNLAYTQNVDPNRIYLRPGESVTIDGVTLTHDAAPSVGPYGYPEGFKGMGDVPAAAAPAAQAPVQPGTVSMSPTEFIERYTVRTQMTDGSWAPTTNSVALQAFGISVGTPLNQIDLNKLRPTAGAEGTIFAPRGGNAGQGTPVSQPAAAQAASPSPASAAMQEASSLLAKINQGTSTHDDVKAFLSKLQEIAQLFGEAVGDSATGSGRIKGKKGAAAQADAAGGGGGDKSVGGAGAATGASGYGNAASALPVGAPAVGSAGGQQVAASSSTGFDTTQGVAGGFTGSTSGKSWLMAIAEAMGNVLGSKVQQMLTSSSRMASLTYDGKGIGAQQDALNAQLNKYLEDHKGSAFVAADYEKLKNDLKPQQEILDTAMKANGQEFTLESSKLQGASQEFSMLQNAFSNAIKSIGEGLGQLARKG